MVILSDCMALDSALDFAKHPKPLQLHMCVVIPPLLHSSVNATKLLKARVSPKDISHEGFCHDAFFATSLNCWVNRQVMGSVELVPCHSPLSSRDVLSRHSLS